MSDAQSLFVFPETGAKVRVVQLEGNPWFLAADVCSAMGYKVSTGGVRSVLNGLDSDERRNADARSMGLYDGTFGGNPTRTFISEAGLYKLALRAQKSRPEVARFQRWVAHEVLPAIRKDGAYVMGEEKVRTGEMTLAELEARAAEAMAHKWKRLEEERDAERARADAAEARAVSAPHAAAHVHMCVNSSTLMPETAVRAVAMTTDAHVCPCGLLFGATFSPTTEPAMPRHTVALFINMRAAPEDCANLASIAGALRNSLGQPFATRSDAIRTALRVAARMAEKGTLADTLKDYHADLAA